MANRSPGRDRRAAGLALRACLAGDGSRARALLLDTPGAQPAFAGAARRHGIAGYAWEALREAGILAPDVELELRGAVHWAVARHLRTLAELDTLAPVLDGADVDWLVFKGPVLAEVVHRGAGRRAYQDLDLLVRPAHLGRALTALEDAGGRTVDRNWALLHRELRGELHVLAPYGTELDLHWHMINQPSTRRAFRVATDELLDRRVEVVVGGRRIPTLDPDDTVVHLALHTVLSGGDRLMWYQDLALAGAAAHVDWDRVAARARSAGASLAVAAALHQTRHLLGSAVPAPLDALAASPTWLAMWRGAFRLAPPERAGGGGSVSRLLARATRESLPASLAELGRRARGWALPRHGHPPLDADHPGSMHFDAGGAHARQAYLAAVAATSVRPEPPYRAGSAPDRGRISSIRR